MTQRPPTSQDDVEKLNDAFARDHDIDAYYADSGFVIGAIEQARLRTIVKMAALRPGERLLEVGCGGGHVLARFRRGRLTGVDVSGEMLAKAKARLAGYEVELLKGELADLALPEHGFDVVVCSEVLEHVVDPASVLTEIWRLAKPNARVIVTFPNDRLIGRLQQLVRATRLTKLPPFRRIGWAGHYHLHVWSLAEMRALLRGFFSIEQEVHVPLAPLPIRCCFLCRPLAPAGTTPQGAPGP